MNKILAVIKREYLQIVRTKTFILGTVLGPVIMGLFIFVPILVSMMSVGDQERIGVVDASREIYEELENRMDFKLKDGRLKYVLENYELTADLRQLKDALNQKVLSGDISGYMYIPENIIEGGTVEFAAENVSDFEKISSINKVLNAVIVEKRLNKAGLDPEEVSRYMEEVKFVTQKVTKKGVEEDTGGTFIVSYILVLILYMTLIFYGQLILRGVIEEKSSRVVEVVLSSLKPSQLMAGKILGIAAVGLTQYLIWAVFGVVLTSYSSSLMSSFFPQASGFKIPSIPMYVFVYFVVFFILGYFLFSTLYAAIGSTVNSEKEAQQLGTPLTMMLVIPILLMMFVMRSPDSTLSIVLSLIPFFSPILMLLRVCVLLPPFIEILSSIVLLITTTVGMIWITGKIYRVGLLMYGKRPSLPEIIKWVRYK
ncbi:MAG TPA: ABC transporter permease [Candidatus Aminicenantes bacterium]|nr:ABC transporter permease [Candidatus Aminicenantes bacterium]